MNTPMPTPTLIIALSAALLAASAASAQSDAERLHAIFDDWHEWRMAEYPEFAMARANYTNADSITDQSVMAISLRHRNDLVFFDRLSRVDPEKLTESDRISYELFELMLQQRDGEYRHRTFLAPIGVEQGPLGGPLFELPQMADGVRFQFINDYENYLARLALLPEAVDHYIERMRLGMEEGRTPPRVTLNGVPGQFDTLLAPGGLDALAEPFESMPITIPSHIARDLRVRLSEDALPAIRAAFHRFRRFAVDEYIPACRTTVAAQSWPDGETFYAFRLRSLTTTDLSPLEIHKLGLAEVDRIRTEMLGVIRSSDFMDRHPEAASWSDDELFEDFVAYLRSSPRFYYDDPADLLRDYRDICKRVDGWMPKLFGRLARLPYGVRPTPDYAAPSSTTAYYNPGSLRNGQPGWFVVNTYDLAQRPKYEMVALALHESVPGHHHQGALAQELDDLPEFRRDAWFTAYGEGWALYAERLGIEMGLYETPYDDFGRLTYEMWRACRLVVDPGVHALGWSRQQAIDFMTRHTALSALNIRNEVDRYIAWPGQACAYKLGEIRIRGMRAAAEEALGTGFDLRAFHDVILEAGSMPLTTLETRVDRWTNERRMAAVKSYD
jgi:uncharacterized protein (DUF885 family)